MAHSAIRTLRNGWGRGGGLRLPPIGSPFQGGYFVGVIANLSEIYAIIMAPKIGQNNALAFKTANTETPGTYSLTDGFANSNAMNNAQHPAAQFCRNLAIADFSDWYLPAKEELNLLYIGGRGIVGPDAVDLDATTYWSSSSRVASNAWNQLFTDGTQSSTFKNAAGRVRAIRRVPIAELR